MLLALPKASYNLSFLGLSTKLQAASFGIFFSFNSDTGLGFALLSSALLLFLGPAPRTTIRIK